MTEMSFRDDVVQVAAITEQVLRDLGGQGSGLGELARSLGDRLPASIRARMDKFARVRNSLVHEPDYRYAGSEVEFLQMCRSVLQELRPKGQTTTAGRGEERPMSTGVSPVWVQKIPVTSTGQPYASTPERRAIWMLQGAAVKVVALGTHRIGWFWFREPRPDSLAFVSMLSQRVEVAASRTPIRSKESVRIDTAMTLELKVRESESAIRSVAQDAAGQEKVIVDRALAALRSVIATLDGSNIAGESERISKETLKICRDQANVQDGFELLTLGLLRLEPASERIREASERSLEEDISAREQQKRADAEHSARLKQLDYERQQKRAQDKAEIESAKKQQKRSIVELDGEFRQHQKRLSMANMTRAAELAHKIRELQDLSKVVETDAGRWALNPEAFMNHLEQMRGLTLQIQTMAGDREFRLVETFLKSQTARILGQNEALRALVSPEQRIALNLGGASAENDLGERPASEDPAPPTSN